MLGGEGRDFVHVGRYIRPLVVLFQQELKCRLQIFRLLHEFIEDRVPLIARERHEKALDTLAILLQELSERVPLDSSLVVVRQYVFLYESLHLVVEKRNLREQDAVVLDVA